MNVPNKIQYPPLDVLDERASLRSVFVQVVTYFRIWKDVNKAIVADDLLKADELKRGIEQAQR
jgi:hypothetical protein